MTLEDLPFANWLRGEVGWNQTLEDWKRFLDMEPEGCFVAQWCGTPVGTATTVTYGHELAWIGMVLVHPEYRRRGIARALLNSCIEHLRHREVRCIKLDATPQGRPVYLELGFKDEWTLSRWERQVTNPALAALPPRLAGRQEFDAERIAACDLAAFGVSRQRFLRALARQSREAIMLENTPGCVEGFGLLRPGSRALYLGPVVAQTPDVGTKLIETLVARDHSERVFWDIPEDNSAAVCWARQHGFAIQRTLTRMYLGENLTPGDLQKQFGLAGPEMG